MHTSARAGTPPGFGERTIDGPEEQAVLPEVQVEEVQLVELQEVIQEQEIHLQ